MKQYIKYLFLVVFLIAIQSCKSDFLNLEPKEGFSEDGFFTNTNDLRNYVNAFYDNTLLLRRISDNRTLVQEAASDNVVGPSPNARLNTRNVSGAAPISTGWGGHYNLIRDVNFFLENAYKVPGSIEGRQYIGEAYFTRAKVYFELLSDYGGVPLITKALNTSSEELYSPRASRSEVAKQIMTDLDSAITNLQWKGETFAIDGRINKETALLFKTRAGLYEGSWQNYHSKKGTPFAPETNNSTEFLQAAVAAGDQLIAHQGDNIYQGSLVDLFQEKDLTSVAGAFFYKVYSQDLSVTHNYYGNFMSGTDHGLTKQFVDEFLMNDGKPSSLSSVTADETSIQSLGINKDPRLAQTMWTRPLDANGKASLFYNIFRANETENASHAYRTSYPGFIITQQRSPSLTGYRPWKGLILDYNEFRNGATPDLIMRYAEALLNYAEAKALLGTISQADLDKTVNVIRGRAGMVPMMMADVNSWNITYSAKDGYDPSGTNVLNEIRRERRVELALEGFRNDDLKRWALLDEVINGFIPIGASTTEFIDYWNRNNGLQAEEGFANAKPEDVVMVQGNNYDVDASGKYFLPFFNDADFGKGGAGGFINPGRDYLSPIGTSEIELYRTKGNTELKQNPGWF